MMFPQLFELVGVQTPVHLVVIDTICAALTGDSASGIPMLRT